MYVSNSDGNCHKVHVISLDHLGAVPVICIQIVDTIIITAVWRWVDTVVPTVDIQVNSIICSIFNQGHISRMLLYSVNVELIF